MDKRNDELLRERARERAIHRYTSALERGDFETVVAVLAQAEHDPELERMIVEVNEVLEAEHEVAAAEQNTAQVRQLLREHLPSGLPDDHEETVPPPLTVAAVAAHMSEDAAQHGHMTHELATIAHQLATETQPMPDELTLTAVRQIFSELGISASAEVIKQFRTTAIYLAEGREHGQAYQAAARRQREMRQPPKSTQTRQSDAHNRQEDRP